MSTAVELLLGAVAGALAQIFTIPVSVIATRQQVGRSVLKSRPSVASSSQVVVDEDLKKANGYDDSFMTVAREIIHEDGITGLWLGIHSSLVLTVNPAITYGMFERIKSIFTLGDPTIKLSPLQSFALGALSKTMATIVSTISTRSD